MRYYEKIVCFTGHRPNKFSFRYNDIELYCIIPFENQAEKWKNEHKLRYNNILKNCNQKILLQKYFTLDCYIKRNKFLVEKSNVIIGVYDEKYALSGTKNTLDYALNMNKKIIIIDPKLLKVFNIKSNF